MRTRIRTVLALIATASLAMCADHKEIVVDAAQVWTDTGIDLNAGDSVVVTATGSVTFPNAKAPAGPDGMPRGWTDLIMQLPVNESGRGALVGRVGSDPAARAFLIGPRTQRVIPVAGRLFLGINEMPSMPGTGSFHVVIERTATASHVSVSAAPLPAFTQQMLDSIPTRVHDALNNPGDRVNFVIVGSQDKLQAAFSAAGWVTVDKTDRAAVMQGLLTSFSKEAYVTLPMSTLELFGRAQDFGYAQADPLRVVASRHHFRLWKAPFAAGGETVWAGAGTHDIGFERDQRNNGITHKIDPQTDGERDYIGQSLKDTGLVVKEEYLTPTQPVKEARTATGGGFSSDGRTLVIYLQPEGHNYAADFAATFCSVLSHDNPDGGTWGPCSQYLEGANPASATALGPLTPEYHVVIVPGFLSSCFADAPAFQKGAQILHDKYGFTVDTIPVPNDPSSSNAKLIAQFLQQQKATQKFILIGYSKGSPDIYEMLATNPGLASRVAAFVSVAGAVGGSPIAQLVPQQADKWIKEFNLSGCKGDLDSGFKSLGRSTRQAFLASYPRAGVQTYSIVGESTKENTSRSLFESWTLLRSYGTAEDGQLLKEDAIVPDSKFLGAALGDHFAVALPFETANEKYLQAGMDKNHYPRAALCEAIVRFVEADLKSQSAGLGR